MSEPNIRLPWGDDDISLSLPEGWHLNGMLEPSPQPGVEDPVEEVQRGLQRPFGSPRLRDLVEDRPNVAVVIDDLSRPTPVDLILPAVLEELRRGGVRREEIALVTALGVHRPMEDRFFPYFALQAMRHADLLLYAPTIPVEVRANLPIVTFVDSPEEAIAAPRRAADSLAGQRCWRSRTEGSLIPSCQREEHEGQR